MGNLRNAALSEVPVSTSVRMSLSNLVTLLLALPRPTMSKACSSGTPAFIMVASWRVKIAMSLGLMALPLRILRLRILVGSTPWRRRAETTWFSPAARVSPLTCLPLRSLPSHSKTNSFTDLLLIAVAIVIRVPYCQAGYSLVHPSTSSIEVMPFLTFNKPDCRKLRTPSRRDCSAISMELPSRKIIRWISSLMGITW